MDFNDEVSTISSISSIVYLVGAVCFLIKCLSWHECFKLFADICNDLFLFLSQARNFFSCSYIRYSLQTTYENFRYRYDRRANPYNLGVVENFKEIFFTSIPPSKNNFRARVPQEQGLQPRQSAGGFMSPNMGKGVVDIEVGRKAMAWGEHEAAACIDIDAGLRNEATDDKDGGLNESSLGSDHILPFEGLGVRAAVEHRQRPLSWGEEQW
ncbi:probable protein S-acyltransferase 6 [Dendrobium catenatum]|uniref:probable protein S-acyltransferase 6 n=1 Tax=Dendrobium catenatum TaxID=906689 RepID=UPI00109F4A28|nr:probable protein S-acyltransferase 6 [Dendrobium catenatum]